MTGIDQSRMLVAAIDFGTTFSGYAFSFRSDFLQDPLKIHANHWTTGSGSNVSQKTSTCVLFKPNKAFHSFGFEAEDKYSELALEEQHSDWYYFRRFKMVLYKIQELSRDFEIEDADGKLMRAMDVFSASIRYLREHMLQAGEDKMYGLNSEEIHWVLTVPAIWSDAAKQFMREAAIQAGINGGNLLIALEPEAASFYCKYLPVERISGEGAVTCFRPASRYLVLDAGGGTIDITVHEVHADGRLKELYKANGGHWGGTKVDEAFQQLLVDIAGLDVMDAFYSKHRDDYLDLFREFELKKRTITMDMDQRITIKLPLSLHDEFVHHRGEDFRKSMLMRQELSGKLTFAGDKLRLDPEIMKNLFRNACSSIVCHLQEIFGQRSVRGTDTILMVGGFSESPVLRQAIKDSFPGKKVVIPNEAGLSVLKGAVIFGHKPAIVMQRVSRFTYGVETYTAFLPNVHEENRVEKHNGERVCLVFDKHVEIGQAIPSSGMFQERRYYPLTSTTTILKMAIYTSTDNNPLYTDDRGCEKLGELIVEYEDLTGGKNRPILAKMIFGGTELGVEVVEEKTGKQTRAAFNFLGETNA
ncbi:hypothetical protein CHS0354_027193 [Potamilus streckersoni]|uniref:Heat shock 70 kDa protein n=1 Tax=Potamilus streckersoni TaxID=2493646 RepID=A0AAE0W6V7_9BIVA|nr:hypothetical protein CHS0354_027193 [Potamilus streckersoni]